MTDGIHKPIIIVGAARSGTGLLISSLARHPDLARLEEPNFVWKAYNADVGHDMIPPSRATAAVKHYIHSRFDAMRRAQGDKARIVEKTPQSAMRLPFVLEVFPDAKIVHVIRDGREVVASARRKYMGSTAKITRSREGMSDRGGSLRKSRAVLEVIRQKWREGIPAGDLLRYGPKIWNMSLGIMGIKKSFAWGPEFPGMRRMMKTHPLVDVCALQWKFSIDGVASTLFSRPDLKVYEVRFERLVRETEKVTNEVFEFAELPVPAGLVPLPPTRLDTSLNLFETELDANEQHIVYERIGETLKQLGYMDAIGPNRSQRISDATA